MGTDLRAQLQTTLGSGYAVERELGGGGMSRVFVAEERVLGRRVVVKVLPPELAAELSVERFRREIQLAARLQHPHVVPLLGAGETNGLLYYTMPWIEGESLRERLRRERQLPVEEAVRIAREVADALAHAHARGVVHRDIKPENILLSAAHAVVADFGIARALTRAAGEETLTGTGTALGTPAYMSPEQAAGEREIDGRSDIYSLACVLYEMLAGQPPFTGPTAQAVISRRFTDPVPRVSSARATVPPAVERALTTALAPVPADRFASAADFARALSGDAATALKPNAAGAPAARVAAAGAAPPDRRSIAVLPFANLSADPENEYFSEGVTEDIISQLSKIGHLKVISRTSTLRYRRTDKGVREIAGELGVDAVLEGSVRRAGERVRVVAQLIDARDDEHLWTDTYDRDLTDVFAIQSDVALRVATALRAVLAPGEKRRVERKPTGSVEAYDWYLLGRHALNKRNVEGIRRSIECFERAIAEDAGYAMAYAGLADAYTLAAIGYGAAPHDAMPRAKAAALRALELDETLAEAHTSLGYINLNYDWDWFAGKRQCRRAAELNPSSAQAHEWYAHCFLYASMRDETLDELARARELDPLSVLLTNETGWPYFYADEYDSALSWFRRALAMDPDFALAHNNVGCVYEAKGMAREALAEHAAAARLSGGMAFTLAFLARAHARLGATDEARRIRDELIERAARGEMVSGWLAFVLDALGETDRAIEYLERAVEAREPLMSYLHLPQSATFHNTRPDARFQAIIDRVGMGAQTRRARGD